MVLIGLDGTESWRGNVLAVLVTASTLQNLIFINNVLNFQLSLRNPIQAKIRILHTAMDLVNTKIIEGRVTLSIEKRFQIKIQSLLTEQESVLQQTSETLQ